MCIAANDMSMQCISLVWAGVSIWTAACSLDIILAAYKQQVRNDAAYLFIHGAFEDTSRDTRSVDS